jgi:hypothetical protein
MNTDSKQKINNKFLGKWCKERKCSFRPYGTKLSILLLGESHGTKRHLEFEEELIKLVKPSTLLHEALRNKTYDPATRRLSFVEGTLNGLLEKKYHLSGEGEAIKLSNKYRMKAVGADLSVAEKFKLASELLKKTGQKAFVLNDSIEAISQREKRMGERIADYCKKVDGMLVGIFGMHHLRPSSGIHPILQLEGIEYACIILPKDKKK